MMLITNWRFFAFALVLAFPVAQAMAEPHESFLADEGHRPSWRRVLQPWLDELRTTDPAVRARLRTAESLAAQAKAARALPDPEISIGVNSVPTDFDIAGDMMAQVPMVTLRQVIPYPGKLSAKRGLGEAQARESEFQASALAEAQALELSITAFEIARLRHEMELIRSTLSWLRLLARSAETQYRVGKGLGQDVDRAKVELGRLEAELSRLRASLNGAESRWLRLMGSEPPDFSFDGEPWTPAADFITEVVKRNPDVQLARELSRTARLQIGVEKSERAPDFSVELGYGVRPKGQNDYLTASIGLTVPLWSNWNRQPRIEGATIAHEAAELGIENAVREASAVFRQAFTEHEEAKKRRELYQMRILPDAARARKSAQGAYDAGGADILIPIEAIRQEHSLQREYAWLEAERRVAEARMLASAALLASDIPQSPAKKEPISGRESNGESVNAPQEVKK